MFLIRRGGNVEAPRKFLGHYEVLREHGGMMVARLSLHRRQ
jgi:hypothetical protein